MISVIVPVYNVEKYLDRCLQSLVNQEFLDYEIVVVDDGSTDSCGRICDRYDAAYPNITVLHQCNQGLSAARNNGVLASHGEFITFVDSDDYVSPDYLSYLFYLVSKYEADIAITSWYPVFSNDSRFKLQTDCESEEVMDAETALYKACYAKEFGISAHSKLYKRNLVLEFPYPLGKLYEDLDTTYKILGKASTIVYGSKNVYYYFQRSDSIMNSSFKGADLYGLEAGKHQLEYMIKYYPNNVRAAEYRCVFKALELFSKILKGTEENKQIYTILKSYIMEYYDHFIHDQEVSYATRVRTRLVVKNYACMRLTTILFLRLKRMLQWRYTI